jgi:Uma2 family endonuclease
MRAVVPESLLAQRRKLGHDRFAETWEGELHMVPAPSFHHHRLVSWLLATWWPFARSAGLVVGMETCLFNPAVADASSYRQPDVVVVRAEHTSYRSIETGAEPVVEIRSPDDETYQKLPFYEQMAVGEVLPFDLDRTLRHRRHHEGRLAEVAADAGSWAQLINQVPAPTR